MQRTQGVVQVTEAHVEISMKVLCCQLTAQGIATSSAMIRHQERVEELVRTHCQGKAVDLVLLPELSAIEYSGEAFINLAKLATELDGWLVNSMSKLACQVESMICFGMPRLQGEHVFISQVFVDKTGKVAGCYDKLHLAQF